MSEKQSPAREPGEVVYLNDLTPNNTTRSNPRKACLCCGYSFIPQQTYYRLCGQCYAYTKAGSHLQAAAKLLKRVRS